MRKVSHVWISDAQIWDLWIDGPPVLPVTDLSQRVKKARFGSKVLIFIDGESRIKGFDKFLKTSLRAAERTTAVIAGRVDLAVPSRMIT